MYDELFKARCLFISTVGTKERVDGTERGGVSNELKELLRYMNDTKSYPVKNSDNELIRRIDAAVGEAKMDGEWRRAYMKYQADLWDLERESEERGEIKTLAGLVSKGLLTLQQAAEERSLTVDDFKKQCKLYNLSL